MENFRRAIGLRIKEVKEVYEGEVTEMTPVETENPFGGNNQKNINWDKNSFQNFILKYNNKRLWKISFTRNNRLENHKRN